MFDRPIYLDYHATTPVDPLVLDAMLPYFRDFYGNEASASHLYGREAKDAVLEARRQVAELLGAADPAAVLFTSGATESNNLAILGVVRACGKRPAHVITVQTEHKAVLEPCRELEREGHEATYLAVDQHGQIDLDELRRAVRPNTVLISVMLANNEVGTAHDIAAIGAIAREAGVPLHCDACQGLGYLDFHVERMHVDLVSLSAHKIYGPKGVGALYVRADNPKTRCAPLLFGSSHEKGLRPGTLNVPGIVGLGEAALMMKRDGRRNGARIRALRQRFERELMSELEGIRRYGADDPARHPANLAIGVADLDGRALMLRLEERIAVSAGSACTSTSAQPSHVLTAMGVEPELATSSYRIGLGRYTTEAEVDEAAAWFIRSVRATRGATRPQFSLTAATARV